jgi:hypothetical protein
MVVFENATRIKFFLKKLNFYKFPFEPYSHTPKQGLHGYNQHLYLEDMFGKLMITFENAAQMVFGKKLLFLFKINFFNIKNKVLIFC